MTNEELMEQFMAGDESVLTKLCNKNEGLIRSRAKEIAQAYNCIQYTQRGKYKAYTKHLLNDLCGVGRITFMDRIRSGKYDREKGMLTTFVVPFIDGDMRRYMEINLGNLALDRDDMTMVRNAQRLHNVEYMGHPIYITNYRNRKNQGLSDEVITNELVEALACGATIGDVPVGCVTYLAVAEHDEFAVATQPTIRAAKMVRDNFDYMPDILI